MTHHTLTASVPRHIYAFVHEPILYGLDPAHEGRFEPCVIIGITSRPSRALCFEILCESGAKWANIPLHMLRWEMPKDEAPIHPLTEIQAWDCHGYDFAVLEFEYLREMGCQVRTRTGNLIDGHYWFTLDHTENGFSLYPPEHKNYNLILLEDGSGQIAALPNNRIRWRDHSFVDWKKPLPPYRVMAPTTWHAEESEVNPQDTAMTQYHGEEPDPEADALSWRLVSTDVIKESINQYRTRQGASFLGGPEWEHLNNVLRAMKAELKRRGVPA